MKQILEHLEDSLKDNYFSKSEKKSLGHLLSLHQPNAREIKGLKNKIYLLAKEKADESNFEFVIKWMEHAQKAIDQFTNSISDAYFSPGEECRNAIIRELQQAQEAIDICVFTISDNVISNKIVETYHRGIPVRILTDNDKSLDRGSDIDQFYREGISVKMDNTSNHMHHKFMVVDGDTLLTGSYNWTRSAAMYNHENILITKDTTVIKDYRDEFESLWNEF